MAQLHGDDELLRRVLNRLDFLVWDDDTERWLPSLAGIRFDPDGMSTFVLRLLARGLRANRWSTTDGNDRESSARRTPPLDGARYADGRMAV